MGALGGFGEGILRLAALGLDIPMSALTRLTHDGWHHMRALRLPGAGGAQARGIEPRTGDGLVVMAAHDGAGGLQVRPPLEGESRREDWRPPYGHPAAGCEDDDRWMPVESAPRTLAVFPGDVLQ